MNSVAAYTAKQLDVIKRTIADGLTPAEFDMFVEQAKRCQLDPFRRQIMPIVFNASKPEYRKIAIVTGIDGYRTMAERAGNYRPDEKEPIFEVDEELVSDTNPKGIVSVSVSPFKWMRDGWYPVIAKVYWEEYVPLSPKKEKKTIAGKEKWVPNGEYYPLDKGSNWWKMPHVMLAKCGEAAALRKGWPDTFAGLYSEDEMARERHLDLTASEAVDAHAADERARKAGGRDATVIDWLDGKALDRVPDGEICDRVIDWAKSKDTTSGDIRVFNDRNSAALRDVWVRLGNDALHLKRDVETILSKKIATENMDQTVQ